MKTFVVGDIHGAYKALIQCLERSNFDKEKDTLISLGDIADGWDEVVECVEELFTIKNLISIRGNHDVWCWNWFKYGHTPQIWTQQGGNATINSYLKYKKYLDENHIKFWNNQIDYFIDDKNRLFVHGGFDIMYGFNWSKNQKTNIPNSTELHWNRDLAEFNEKSTGKLALNNLDEFYEIYIGHTTHNNYNLTDPRVREGKRNVWNLDTGAGWNGILTIMNVDTKEFYQSDNVKTLYPNSLGRR